MFCFFKINSSAEQVIRNKTTIYVSKPKNEFIEMNSGHCNSYTCLMNFTLDIDVDDFAKSEEKNSWKWNLILGRKEAVVFI